MRPPDPGRVAAPGVAGADEQGAWDGAGVNHEDTTAAHRLAGFDSGIITPRRFAYLMDRVDFVQRAEARYRKAAAA